MKISENLQNKYSNYYGQENLSNKRELAAAQTVEHICTLAPTKKNNLLDIGAGEGAILSELDRIGIANNLHAIEISESGLKAIKSRQIPTLRTLKQFDGYTIDASDKQYDFGTNIHVLEHVEHERAFLAEISRVCKSVYIEVPLELTLRVNKSIRSSGQYGHINFYNPSTLQNLIETSDLKIIDFKVFTNSLAYERFVSGYLSGTVKHIIRSTLLSVMPRLAPYLMTYLAGVVVCRNEKISTS